jgi:hypothetical protein
MTVELEHAKVPCPECPWRKDTPPGQFTAERYELLRESTHDEEDGSARFGAPIFACHKSKGGQEFACAGCSKHLELLPSGLCESCQGDVDYERASS